MSLIEKGLLWKDCTQIFDKPDEDTLKKYNEVYKLIGKGNNHDYREKSHVSRIRKSLKAHAGIVSNLDLFLPDKLTSKEEIVFNIPIPPDLVYVIEGSKGKEKEIRLVDSEYWKSILWKDIKH